MEFFVYVSAGVFVHLFDLLMPLETLRLCFMMPFLGNYGNSRMIKIVDSPLGLCSLHVLPCVSSTFYITFL